MMIEPRRLSTTHVVTRDGNDYISRYSVPLVGGGSLIVRMPASLRRRPLKQLDLFSRSGAICAQQSGCTFALVSVGMLAPPVSSPRPQKNGGQRNQGINRPFTEI
jgi:hypothetical protein